MRTHLTRICTLLLIWSAAGGTGRVPTAHAQGSAPAVTAPLQTLSVSPNQRFLVKADGTPFFYLADTAWELFHRLDREQARGYLQLRADQRYTVVQAVALAEVDGPTVPNAHGGLPFIDTDPTRPAMTPGADPADPRQYDYWDHVDFIVDEANRLGMYIGFLPTWATWVNPRTGGTAYITTPEQAQSYGEFLGRRYGRKGVIWVIGGDRPAEGYEHIWHAMARGIAIGVSGREDYGALLMTYHPQGGQTSSTWFHEAPWLDFNMQQTGHGPAGNVRGWDRIAADYARTPVKPVVDGEPLYEDHPIGFQSGSPEHGFSSDAHVRQRAYWHVFAGAAGLAYGHHSVWQMYAPGRRPINGPLYFWDEAIHRPGAAQMQHLRSLIESRPQLVRVPDPTLVLDPLDGPSRIQATRGDDYLFVYSGAGHPFTVNMGRISGARVRAYWYNPRNGTSTEIGTFENTGTREFRPQYVGLGSDWVLVLDDQARGYAAPGRLVAGP